MSLSKIKVHRGDDRLAHGIVKSRRDEIVAKADRDRAMISKSKSASAMIESLTKHYGKRILAVFPHRLKGSRAKAEVMCAEACEDGSYVLALYTWRGNCDPKMTRDIFIPLEVSAHAVARAMQRSLGVGDVDEAVRIIFLSALNWFDSTILPEGKQAVLRGFGGEARVERSSGWIVVRTWLGVEDLPEWKRESAMARELTVEFKE